MITFFRKKRVFQKVVEKITKKNDHFFDVKKTHFFPKKCQTFCQIFDKISGLFFQLFRLPDHFFQFFNKP